MISIIRFRRQFILDRPELHLVALYLLSRRPRQVYASGRHYEKGATAISGIITMSQSWEEGHVYLEKHRWRLGGAELPGRRSPRLSYLRLYVKSRNRMSVAFWLGADGVNRRWD